jgi:hypothetical protein
MNDLKTDAHSHMSSQREERKREDHNILGLARLSLKLR